MDIKAGTRIDYLTMATLKYRFKRKNHTSILNNFNILPFTHGQTKPEHITADLLFPVKNIQGWSWLESKTRYGNESAIKGENMRLVFIVLRPASYAENYFTGNLDLSLEGVATSQSLTPVRIPVDQDLISEAGNDLSLSINFEAMELEILVSDEIVGNTDNISRLKYSATMNPSWSTSQPYSNDIVLKALRPTVNEFSPVGRLNLSRDVDVSLEQELLDHSNFSQLKGDGVIIGRVIDYATKRPSTSYDMIQVRQDKTNGKVMGAITIDSNNYSEDGNYAFIAISESYEESIGLYYLNSVTDETVEIELSSDIKEYRTAKLQERTARLVPLPRVTQDLLMKMAEASTNTTFTNLGVINVGFHNNDNYRILLEVRTDKDIGLQTVNSSNDVYFYEESVRQVHPVVRDLDYVGKAYRCNLNLTTLSISEKALVTDIVPLLDIYINAQEKYVE